MASSLASTLRLSSNPSPTGFINQRIILLDNTVSAPPSEVGVSDENLPEPPSNASTASEQKYPGRRETLRKAIAQRKYRRWSAEPFPSVNNSEENLDDTTGESPDPKAGGIVKKIGEDEEVAIGGGLDGGGEGSKGRGGRERSDTGGNAKAGKTEVTERRTGRKKKGEEEKEIAEIDILYENQRGIFICGIPLFSSKGLLNFDPPAWQNRHHAPSLVSILNAQVPDPTWVWAWKSWYVDMTTDVDEEGWTYSFSFNPSFSWHGTHIWFHSFVRRRRWLRKRVKLHTHETGSACGSREGSRERPHGLNPDYFTIHSRTQNADSSTAAGATTGAKKLRRSVMEGASWSWKDEDGDGKEDSEPQEESITDIPRLMSVLHCSRLDREKIEAVEGFLRDGGEEVAYLPERIPAIMSLMIFQASRRQLLSLFIAESEKAEIEANSPTPPAPEPSTPPAPLPPTPSEPTTPQSEISVSSQNALLPPSPSPLASAPSPLHSQDPEPTPPTLESHLKSREFARRKLDMLKKAINIADEEVKRMEYWSDVAEIAATGQTKMAPRNGMGIGGPVFPAGEEGPGIEWVEGRVDLKGKGKERLGRGNERG